MFTLSLGATCPGPPRTCRGTMVREAAAAAPALRNVRRERDASSVMTRSLPKAGVGLKNLLPSGHPRASVVRTSEGALLHRFRQQGRKGAGAWLCRPARPPPHARRGSLRAQLLNTEKAAAQKANTDLKQRQTELTQLMTNEQSLWTILKRKS